MKTKTAALLMALAFILVLVVTIDLSGGYFSQVDTAETIYNHGQKVEYRTAWLDAGNELAFDLQHNSDRRDEIITRLEKIRTEFEPVKTELSDEESSDLFRIDQALQTREVQRQQSADTENNR